MGRHNYNIVTNSDQLYKTVMIDIYSLMLLFAVIILLLGILRSIRTTTTNPQLTLDFYITIFVVIILIALLPDFAPKLKASITGWSTQYSEKMSRFLAAITQLQVDDGGWTAIKAKLCNLIFSISMSMATFVRYIVTMFLGFIFDILISLSPLFVSLFSLPETRSIAINYFMFLLGLTLLPVCYLFGDIIGIQVMIWALGATGIASTGTAAITWASSAVLVGAAPAALIASAVALATLGILFFFIMIVVYIGIPISVIALLRGSGMISSITSTLNTASNVTNAATRGAGGVAGNSQLMSNVKEALKK